jgi:hypothetical protein
VPKQLKRLLTDVNSKNTLIRFLVQQWKKEKLGCDLYLAYDNQCNLMEASGTITTVDELATDQAEADTRMVLHVHHCAMQHDNITMYTPDTDVFFIALKNLSFFP